MFAKINHLAIVSENYAALAQFYEGVFGMKTSGRTRPGRAITVGDGYIGLNISPRRKGRMARLDHFGFRVESLAALQEDVETISRNPHLRPVVLGIGRECRNRLDIFRKTCPLGASRMADSDGVLIDAAECTSKALSDKAPTEYRQGVRKWTTRAPK